VEIMNVTEAAQRLGNMILAKSIALRSPGKLLSKSYYLPSEAVRQTLLARSIARIVASGGPCWLQITYWNSDADSNQHLFHGYRRGMGDERTLADASVYKFFADEESYIATILSMVIYFAWDARIFDSDLSYQVRVNNDGFLDFEATSTFGNAIEHEFSILGLSEMA
jgi:hypothetical protein